MVNKEDQLKEEIIKKEIEFFDSKSGKIVIENGAEFIKILKEEAQLQREQELNKKTLKKLEQNIPSIKKTQDQLEINNILENSDFEFFEFEEEDDI
jgi:hypothetical protein